MVKGSAKEIRTKERDVEDWTGEVKRLGDAAVLASGCDKLKNTEIPALESEMREKEAEQPEASRKAQEVCFITPVQSVTSC